ncbi:hypothetical protein RND71_016026 [Anisodus tanguticus]|uniref:Uncharacterized protein n=1 Tax=Anisodus tanguticus TaxID=243964 RepID=A0AAE1S8K1_9SOLA|nr:hypothetical protein RND71_016026 [Anisodus tanguticus]
MLNQMMVTVCRKYRVEIENTEIVSAFTFISAVVSALLIIVASLRNFAMSVSNKTRVLAVESIGQVPLLDALDSPMFESNAIARFRRVEL